ncbi:GNAT family N-acetyltransferase [Plantactinospora sp. KBS50]|uniref:GNAT family N-acetyltransferase n=1 Tax=Plantactinospora sp. KBS50 TaxID=2024580 RepID=UPI000BAAE8DB|nr:GNAT family N-acetyltransferase [Plantactinospora sp. KBS50]ASW57963.1 GNAT family N-acetyltransferase [Plantactinospora sp. KBS50]
MVHELAEFERAPERCRLTVEQLHAALFPVDRPAALFGHLAVDAGGEPLGTALWFLNFSTWAGVHGIYLEDLYVRPAARGAGVGRRLLATLAAICVDRGYERFEWWMLNWNPAADFYRSVGAERMDEWAPYRLSGSALRRLAGQTGPVPPARAADLPTG